MKKFSILILMLFCLFITGCGEPKEKNVATLEDFELALVNNNFKVTDTTDNYKEVNYIEESRKGIYNDIEIEMIKYTDIESAEKVLETHIESFNLLKSTGASEKNSKGTNYHKYFLISNNRYMVSVRVEDTLVFCKTLIVNKETVDNVLNEIGY